MMYVRALTHFLQNSEEQTRLSKLVNILKFCVSHFVEEDGLIIIIL